MGRQCRAGRRVGLVDRIARTRKPRSQPPDLVHQLGGLFDLEVGVEPGEPHGGRLERVGPQREAARAGVDGFEQALARRDPRSHPLDGRVEDDAHGVLVRRRGHGARDVPGEVVVGRGARGEVRRRGDGRRDAIDAEGPPVLPGRVPGDEVPAPVHVDDAMRFDGSLALGAAVVAVPELDAAVARAGGRQGRYGPELHGRSGLRQADERRTQRLRLPSQALGQDALELRHRPLRGVLHPRHRARRRDVQCDGDRDRLVVVEHQRKKERARLEAVAARGPRRRLHRIPETAQAIDVPPERPVRDLEPRGQVGARPAPPRLQDRQEAQDAHRGLQHAPRFFLTEPRLADRNRPQRPEQAFSPDGGATWEVNWTMEFTRVRSG